MFYLRSASHVSWTREGIKFVKVMICLSELLRFFCCWWNGFWFDLRFSLRSELFTSRSWDTCALNVSLDWFFPFCCVSDSMSEWDDILETQSWHLWSIFLSKNGHKKVCLVPPGKVEVFEVMYHESHSLYQTLTNNIVVVGLDAKEGRCFEKKKRVWSIFYKKGTKDMVNNFLFFPNFRIKSYNMSDRKRGKMNVRDEGRFRENHTEIKV